MNALERAYLRAQIDVARRREIERPPDCEMCGDPLPTTRVYNQRFCSKPCQRRHARIHRSASAAPVGRCRSCGVEYTERTRGCLSCSRRHEKYRASGLPWAKTFEHGPNRHAARDEFGRWRAAA